MRYKIRALDIASLLSATGPYTRPVLGVAWGVVGVVALLADRATRSRIAEADAEARRKQRADTKLARATRYLRKQDEQKRRSDTRREALLQFRKQLPARLIIVPLCLAVAAAWRGQFEWARDGLHWSMWWSGGLATALETLGLALGAMARTARDDDDTTIVERILMWSVVASAAYLNWQHSLVLGLMSIAGVAGWEVYERRRYRHRLRMSGKLPKPHPRFGVARWVRYPGWAWRAWSIALRDSVTDPDTAWSRAATERTATPVALPDEPPLPEPPDSGETPDTATTPTQPRATKTVRTRKSSGPVATVTVLSKRGGATKVEKMRAVFDRYVAEGKLDELSGGVLAGPAEAHESFGRRYLAKWRDELAQKTQAAEAR